MDEEEDEEDEEESDEASSARNVLTHIEKRQLIAALAKNVNGDTWEAVQESLPEEVQLRPKQVYATLHPDKFQDKNDKELAKAAFTSEFVSSTIGCN